MFSISRNAVNNSKGSVGQKGERQYGDREKDFNNNNGKSTL